MSDEILRDYRRAVAELTASDGPFALKSVTVEGQLRQVYACAPDNVSDLCEAAVAAHGATDLIEYLGERRTCAQVIDEAASLGAALRGRYGIAPGDRVGIAMRNLPQWFTAFVALSRIGAVATLFNSRGTADETANAATMVGCRLIFADDGCAERLLQANVPVQVIGLNAMAGLCAEGGPDRSVVRVAADEPAVILFTSGTTGRPKGATLTHRNITNMAVNLRFVQKVAMLLAARRTGMSLETLAKATPPPSALLVAPLFHVSGLVNVFVALSGGGLLTLMRRWDPAEAVRLIEKNRVSSISGPTMVIADLLAQPGGAERMQTLRSVVVGGQATPLALSERVTTALPHVSQASGWGMTELSGQASGASGAMFAASPGTCGMFNPLFEARIVGPDGQVRAPGDPGELQVRGALVMKGYYNEPEATARSFVDGWFRTGDVAVIDADGILTIVDRQKDMVISAGENIYCAEVERVLGAHADIADVVMFGMPDARLGERAIAAVALRAGAELDADAVRAVAAAQLADYKVPREVVFGLDPFPRNDVGKVDKNKVRALYMARMAAAA